MSLQELSNVKLIENLVKLVAKEKECTHQVILHLAEMQSRRLYAELGYASLFDYATRALGYSRMSAQRRIVAARVMLKAPKSVEHFESGALTLAHFEVIAPVLSDTSATELVQAVAGKTVEEARIIALRSYPPRAVSMKDRVDPIISSHGGSKRQPELFESAAPKQEMDEEARFRIAFTASEKLKRKLEKAQKLLFGASPDGRMENVLEEIVDYYLKRCSPEERQERRKKRAEKKAAKMEVKDLSNLVDHVQELRASAKRESRVPSTVLRDRVLEKDGYRCSYVAEDETRCECDVNLEIDHIVPWARGGKTEENNLRVLCKTHNLMCARKEFGERFVEEKSSYSRSGVE